MRARELVEANYPYLLTERLPHLPLKNSGASLGLGRRPKIALITGTTPLVAAASDLAHPSQPSLPSPIPSPLSHPVQCFSAARMTWPVPAHDANQVQ